MKKSKKAFLFNITLVFITIIVLTAAFLVILNKKSDFSYDIGQRQFEIVKTADSAQDIALYIKESVKLAADQAIYDLGQKGGFANNALCPTFEGFQPFRRENQDCYPKNIQENFNILLNSNLNKYISQYPLSTGVKIPKDSYEFLVYDKKLIVNSFENIELSLYDNQKNKVNAKIAPYSLKPSFVIPFDHSLDYYKEIITKSEEIFLLCSQMSDASDIRDCIASNLLTPEFANWDFLQADFFKYPSLKDADKIFFFEVDTGKNARIYESSQITDKKIIINFILYFGESTLENQQTTSVTPTIPVSQSSIVFTFSPITDIPQNDEKRANENIYRKDLYDIAQELDVNYYILLGIIGTESSFGTDINKQGDKKAHGAMQMFNASVDQIRNSLIKKYPELAAYESYQIYDEILTKNDRDSMKIQIYAGTLYLKWTKIRLASLKKPTDTRTIIQAYHDGYGNIRSDGTSKLFDNPAKRDEALAYVGKVYENGGLV